MASDYKAICDENQAFNDPRVKNALNPFTNLCSDRTHFIFELLQNAEDALGRRGDNWRGSREVTFALAPDSLMLRHFGEPFNGADVRSVCSYAESTKDERSIGRFGIGFKSVYAFTDRPEIHSGDEDFAIESYVFPKRVDVTKRAKDETQIILPLKLDNNTAQQEIAAGFRRLGPSVLLFLRHISKISWNVQGGASGVYLRSDPEPLSSNVQRITVIGKETDKADAHLNFLVFHRDVFSDTKEKIGRVEIAFSLASVKNSSTRWSVQPVARSPLVVFFPTDVQTNLGFLVQGPYLTTPSRDNIRDDPWNHHLVKETASLLVETMRWMRDNDMLNMSALRCLPLDRKKFEETMFMPIFDAVRQAFLDEPLLPRFDGGFVAAKKAKLASTKELRELFSPEQVTKLLGSAMSAWLMNGIASDGEIRQYLIRELNIKEVTTDALIQLLTRPFLEKQSDDWVQRLYEFLSDKHLLFHRYKNIPLIRLDDGTHVVARENDKANAFLPGAIDTGFPTIRRAVCATEKALSFLISLGITRPDLVDDVVQNVLPKYQEDEIDVGDEAYAADIGRIHSAFRADSKQHDKLISALQETCFVMVVDTGDGESYFAKPGDIYIATERLKQLFAGVPGVFIVDNTYDCLRGEEMRELLEACGALRYPRLVEMQEVLTRDDLLKRLKEVGQEEISSIRSRNVIHSYTLQGFDALIDLLPKLTPGQRTERARLIWESLCDLEERRHDIFNKSATCWAGYTELRLPVAFLRHLNKSAWIPDANGELVRPGLVEFDKLDWEPNSFLLTKIAFKPPIIDQLAKVAGIDPELLDTLVKLDLTSLDKLSRHGISLDTSPSAEPETAGKSSGGDMAGSAGRGGQRQAGTDTLRRGGTGNNGTHDGSGGHFGGKSGGVGSSGQGRRTPNYTGKLQFISYVGTHPDDEIADPDGLERKKRDDIEKDAINLIIAQEPTLQRTEDPYNKGFDLFEGESIDKAVRWVEVKSMTGSWKDKPVRLSHTQFNCARKRGEAYWLYVVEYATDPGHARLYRIQDPAGRALTFTFDSGWSEIAEHKDAAFAEGALVRDKQSGKELGQIEKKGESLYVSDGKSRPVPFNGTTMEVVKKDDDNHHS